MWNSADIAYWFSHRGDYPVGLKTWTIVVDYQLCDLPESEFTGIIIS